MCSVVTGMGVKERNLSVVLWKELENKWMSGSDCCDIQRITFHLHPKAQTCFILEEINRDERK